MNCWRGICMYRTDDNCCSHDGIECDIEKVGSPGASWHTCHYEREHEDFDLTCRQACYSYNWCEEV